MKIKDFTQMVIQAIERHNIDQSVADDFAEYSYYGLRFENKDRQVGDICNNSRHNFDRVDERDFPEYGSEEYDDMPELDGTSAWYIDENGGNTWQQAYKGRWQSDEDDLLVVTDHCYLVAGDVLGNHDDPDENEIVIQDAIVIEKFF